MIKKISVKTHSREEIIDITHLVAREVAQAGLDEGQVTVFIPHTTAGVTINENADPSVKQDVLTGLRHLNFESLPFTHMEGNSPAHLKSILTGQSIQIMVDKGRMVLGTWQGIYFCEFDGPRNREAVIQVFKVS